MFARRTLVRILAVLFAALAAKLAAAHPKPGAHADVRISVEPDRVRFDVLMNILFADQCVNAPRARIDDVLEHEEPALTAALAEFFGAGREPGRPSAVVDRATMVSIDGIPAAPLITHMSIVRPEPETRPGFIQNPALLIPRIHVIAEYPCKQPPKTVSMVWGAYPRDYITPSDRDIAPPTDIEAVLTSAGDLNLITFRKHEPEIIWHRAQEDRSRLAAVPPPPEVPTSAVPMWSVAILAVGAMLVLGAAAAPLPRRRAVLVAGVVCSIAAAIGVVPRLLLSLASRPVPEADALAAFTPLHANIYRAFDYTRESDIYDALARSVDGPLLDAIYNDVYRGLVMQEEGGALARVRSVTPLSTSVLPTSTVPRGFDISARWRVEGVVYHWGHSHTRINEYAAEYAVAPRPGGWRIVAARPLEQRRIETISSDPAQPSTPAAAPPAPAPAP